MSELNWSGLEKSGTLSIKRTTIKNLLVVLTGLLLITLITSCQTNIQKEENPDPVEMKPMSADSFFVKSARSHFKISPEGSTLSCLIQEEGSNRLFLKKQEETYFSPLKTDLTAISEYYWAEEDILLIQKDDKLYSEVLSEGQNKLLNPYQNSTCRLIDLLPSVPDTILVSMNQRSKLVFDLWRINLRTGKKNLEVKNPGFMTGWKADREGIVRIATAVKGTRNLLMYRKSSDSNFRIILNTHFTESFVPFYFNKEGNLLYGLSDIDRDTRAAVSLNPETGQETEVISYDEQYDASAILYDTVNHVNTAVIYDKQQRTMVFLNEERKFLQENLQKKLGDRNFSVKSKTLDENTLIIKTFGNREPGEIYLYNKAENNLVLLNTIYPEINSKRLGETVSLNFSGRNDDIIQVYLTLPAEKEPNLLPLILLPHGGPWTRDREGFNREVQLLAFRGYAVLRVNYRGSAGFGKEFRNAGFRQWGQDMQNDLHDAAFWAIREQIADPEHIAIMGHSYGGYAALMGLIQMPTLFACGISDSGIISLFDLFTNLEPGSSNRTLMFELIGHPSADKDIFIENSPYFRVDELETPLFLSYGTEEPNNRTVSAFISALKTSSKIFLNYPRSGEGHQHSLNQETEKRYYSALLDFLDIYMITEETP